MLTISTVLLSVVVVVVIITHFGAVTSSPAPPPLLTSLLGEPRGVFPEQPDEVLAMKTIQIYPSHRNHELTANKHRLQEHHPMEPDNKIIHVRLLEDYQGYHPTKFSEKTEKIAANELATTPDEWEREKERVFGVKTVTNGQFSDQRVKMYRLPEFYAILFYNFTY